MAARNILNEKIHCAEPNFFTASSSPLVFHMSERSGFQKAQDARCGLDILHWDVPKHFFPECGKRRFHLLGQFLPFRKQINNLDAPVFWNVASRSEEHTSELQSLMRISYAVFCLKKKKQKPNTSQ